MVPPPGCSLGLGVPSATSAGVGHSGDSASTAETYAITYAADGSSSVPAGLRVSLTPSTVNLPDVGQARNLMKKTTTPLESDVARRLALVVTLKSMILDDKGGIQAGLRCLGEIFDATITSDEVCGILACDSHALQVLDDLARQRMPRFAAVQSLALRILVNVSNLKHGADAIAAIGTVTTFLDQARQLRVSSNEAQQEAGHIALRGISNVLAGL